MEIVCKRFPLVAQLVIKDLDDQSLTKIKKSSRKISEYLNNERFYWIKIIKGYSRHFEGHEKSWREVINGLPFKIIKQLAIEVQYFFKTHSFFDKMAPLHIGVEEGTYKLCRYIIENTKDKNPEGNYSLFYNETLFKLESSKLFDDIQHKITPLHLAAMHGFVKKCKLILENIDDCNPKNNDSTMLKNVESDINESQR